MPDTTKAPEIRLAEFLAEYVRSRTSQVRKVSDYAKNGAVLWFHEAPVSAGVTSIARGAALDEDGDAASTLWLEVEQPKLPPAPEPVRDLRPWISEAELLHEHADVPALQRRAQILRDDDGEGGGSLVEESLEDHPGVTELYSRFSAEWRQWANSCAEQIRARDLYEKLYRIHTQMVREGEFMELRVGLGLVDWPNGSSKGAKVRRHAVTLSAALSFNSKEGIIRLQAPDEGVEVSLETDMFEAAGLPARDARDEVQAELERLRNGDLVWQRSEVDGVLQQWSRLLHPRAAWDPGLVPAEAAGDGEAPTMSFAPALILRKRGEAAMIRMYDGIAAAIAKSIEETGKAPAGWSALVEPMDDRVGGEGGNGVPGAESPDHWPTRGDEIFFPLPANREQREIVEAVQTRRGVLVQGPPGTGKSHTIANLMCHLLASGQRVLVTAENPRALSVLLEKLPAELRPLCVNVLGQGGASFSDLDATIQKISAKQNNWSKRTSEEKIQRLRGEKERVERRADEVEREFRDLVFGEAVRHEPAAGYSGLPSELVLRVERERADYGWLELPQGAASDPPLNSADLVEWGRLYERREEFVRAQVSSFLPDPEALPSRRELEDLFSEEAQARADYEGRGGAEGHRDVERWLRLPGDDFLKLVDRLRDVAQAWSSLTPGTWKHAAAAAFLGGENATQWRAALATLPKIVETLQVLEEKLGSSEIRLPESRGRAVLMNDAQIVLEHLESGGKWKRLIGTPKPVQGREYFLTEASVDGSPADEAFEFQLILFELKRRQLIEDAAGSLPDASGLVLGGPRQAEGQGVRAVLEELLELELLVQEDVRLKTDVSTRLSATLEPSWLSESGGRWVTEVGLAESLRRRELAKAAIEAAGKSVIQATVRLDAHPLVGKLSEALAARDLGGWQVAAQGLSEVAALHASQERLSELTTLVEGALPKVVARFQGANDPGPWEERFQRFESAWRWAFTERWLAKFGQPGRVDSLERERRGLSREKASLTEQLAAEYAWLGFFSRLTAKENMALKAWLQAVKKIGKGTGRSAKIERLRRDARKHMAACRDAIPVWIMPRYLVAEMIEPVPERFDTVIIDEASQMGVNGLFVFFLAKRTIVVGDDQQVSPSDVGVQEVNLQQLRKDHIPDIDATVVHNRGASVYEQAELCFQRTLSLREHFRCMPEIIQFSNDLCYAPRGAPLDPLRTFGRERLAPLKAEYVVGGVREGKQQAKNEIEAKVIVRRIQECIEDPAYDGKTFGVISLTGSAQAKLIESMLLEALDPRTYEERQILCGDSATFQGDERHVIFLSMVVARGETRLTAQTADTYRQRYNVAASRAQDQMWLMHSVEPADLKPDCLRRRLIEFMRTPARVQLESEREKCESPFEEEVFDRIHDRGYHVVSQVSAGDGQSYPYRIDLVVEGLRGNRLAVECDGSRYHGPEQEEADQARQRDLERVGWEFLRIPGSAFYRDKDAAMEPLWRALEERQILPGAQGMEVDCDGPDESDTGPSNPTELPADAQPQEPQPSVEPEPEPEVQAGSELIVEALQAVKPTANTLPNARPRVPEEAPSLHSAKWRYTVQRLSEDWVPPAEPKTVPDPRKIGVRQLAKQLASLLESVGPIPATALFRIYRERSPINRIGNVVEDALQRALRSAIRKEEIVREMEPGSEEWGGILRTLDSYHVLIRGCTQRRFEDVPPSEWAARMRIELEQLDSQPTFEQAEDIKRRILTDAGYSTMTVQRKEVLTAAWSIATDVRISDVGGGLSL